MSNIHHIYKTLVLTGTSPDSRPYYISPLTTVNKIDKIIRITISLAYVEYSSRIVYIVRFEIFEIEKKLVFFSQDDD